MKPRSIPGSPLLALIICLLLVSCGSGTNGNSSINDNALNDDDGTILTGRFVDSAVAGLAYATSSGLTGMTNAAGEFRYLPGDQVDFSLGPIVLGSVPGASNITPFDLAGFVLPSVDVDFSDLTGDVFQYHQGIVSPFSAGVNLLVFLQSLDQNNNPDDGIVITQAVANFFFQVAAAVLFNQSEDNFLQAFLVLFTQLVTSNVLDRDPTSSSLVDSDDAIAHFLRSLATN